MKKIIDFFKRLFGKKRILTAKSAIPKEKRNALIIGIENSFKFGSCPGARRDSAQMRNLLWDNCARVRVLQDKQATKSAIVSSMLELVDKTDEDGIFILTYSGHGGSEKFSDTKDETDGKDEFLCCYDTYLKDDDIWEIVSRCKGKVFLVFDCCHSETMFRAPLIPPEDLMKIDTEDDLACGFSRSGKIDVSPVDMLVWSGCPDNTYSYGDSQGGLFTNAFLTALKNGKKTYEEIWNSVSHDKELTRYSQKPQRTVLGAFDVKNDIWN